MYKLSPVILCVFSVCAPRSLLLSAVVGSGVGGWPVHGGGGAERVCVSAFSRCPRRRPRSPRCRRCPLAPRPPPLCRGCPTAGGCPAWPWPRGPPAGGAEFINF